MVTDDGATSPELERFRCGIARLLDDDGVVGLLVTRVAVHWETVGPHAFPRHVNREERLEWRIHREDGRPDVFWDEVSGATGTTTEVLAQWERGLFEVGGERWRVEWLQGTAADDAWSRHGW